MISVCIAPKHFFVCVCAVMPWAEIRWTELISGTGGELCASDSSEVVNSLDKRSLVSHGSDQVHCTLQKEPRERKDCHVLAALKLWKKRQQAQRFSLQQEMLMACISLSISSPKRATESFESLSEPDS